MGQSTINGGFDGTINDLGFAEECVVFSQWEIHNKLGNQYRFIGNTFWAEGPWANPNFYFQEFPYSSQPGFSQPMANWLLDLWKGFRHVPAIYGIPVSPIIQTMVVSFLCTLNLLQPYKSSLMTAASFRVSLGMVPGADWPEDTSRRDAHGILYPRRRLQIQGRCLGYSRESSKRSL